MMRTLMGGRQGARASVLLVFGVLGTLEIAALPVSSAQPFSSAQPIYASQHGGARNAPPPPPGYLGVDVRDVADDHGPRLKGAHGAEVIGVDHDGPAGKMGLHEHDVIVKLNGVGVNGQDHMRRMMRDLPAGRTIVLIVSRQGQTLTLSAQMADLSQIEREAWEQHLTAPSSAAVGGPSASLTSASIASGGDSSAIVAPAGPVATGKTSKSFLGTLLTSPTYTGAMFETISPQLGQYFGVSGRGGLLVRSVAGNSPAEMAGLKAGDVVTKVNFKAMISVNAWTKMIKEAKGKPVTVTVVRDRQEKTLTVVPDVKRK